MELNVRIEKDLPQVVSDAISFETGLSKAQLEDASVIGYEHHGSEFSSWDKGALPAFYEDLILGRQMPPVFAVPKIQDIDTLLAITLFLHRGLPVHPNTASTVFVVDFVHRLGLPALVHLDPTLALFFSAIRAYFPDKGLSQRELSTRIQNAVTWFLEYIYNGTLSITAPPPPVEVRILDQGSTGFVIAETTGRLLDGWVELYRLGFLRGVLVKPSQKDDRKHVSIARKSLYLAFDLQMACRLLNQMETAMGEPPGWKVSPDQLWLESPEEGTMILLSHITEILIRV